MNNPNMYTNKQKRPGYLRYFLIWGAIIIVIGFFLVMSLGQTTNNAYSWNIDEYEYALTNDNTSEKVDDDNFANKYQFDRDNITGIEIELGYMKSNVVVSYTTLDNKNATASIVMTTSKTGMFLPSFL